nr:hypothetical protein [Tanacetum cinerariifolium]
MRMKDCASCDLTTKAHGRSGEGEEWIWCGAGVWDSALGKIYNVYILARKTVVRQLGQGQMRGFEYAEQDRKAAILYEYETFKDIEGEQLLDTYLCYLQKDKDEQVLLAKDQAWMDSSSDLNQEINANMVFMAQIEKVLS